RYEKLKSGHKLYRSTMLQSLALITLLVLFIAFWMAINISRSIADPVQKLAAATERIKRGELDHYTDVVGDDELAALALSFNEMTRDLAENRRRLEQSACDLQSTNAQLVERRQYIEAILQSLSAGVISLDETGNITTINGAALTLLQIEPGQVFQAESNGQTGVAGQGYHPLTGRSLERLLPEEQRDELRRLILLAARYRSVTREVHFTLANKVKLDAAVTVTALPAMEGPGRGLVIVIEDLSELLEAQRRAAWSEVARRMAHEIRNPLTPIRLSAERLARNLLGGCRYGRTFITAGADGQGMHGDDRNRGRGTAAYGRRIFDFCPLAPGETRANLAQRCGQTGTAPL
ncbi:MAG: HAMP domain-containing protein, partial [Acidobacteria bacterium]|nr:HAMP domain-containing protein [Acidobacteriota bacterium]